MKIFNLIPKDFSLSKKLTTLMLTIFLGGIIVSSVVYYNIILGNAENELNRQSDALISLTDSIRAYNANTVTPLLNKNKKLNEEILLDPTIFPLAIPTVAAAEVFKNFTKAYQENYGEYLYRNAMLVPPTNPNDIAKKHEKKIANKLKEEFEAKKAGNAENILNIARGIKDQGFLKKDKLSFFYYARPIIITDKKCLSCHTSLEKSPAGLQELYKQRKYSDSQGFGWKLNEVIGTKIIYVPAAQVYKTAHRNFLLILGIFIAIFAVSILLVNLWLKQYVVRPLNRMTKVAEAVSLGDMDANFEKQSNDEVGRLADAFTRMKTSLGIAMKRLAKKSDRSPDESN